MVIYVCILWYYILFIYLFQDLCLTPVPLTLIPVELSSRRVPLTNLTGRDVRDPQTHLTLVPLVAREVHHFISTLKPAAHGWRETEHCKFTFMFSLTTLKYEAATNLCHYSGLSLLRPPMGS